MQDVLILIAMVLAISGIVIIMVRKGYVTQLKQGLLYLVVLAEEQYGGGTGEIKFAAVSQWIFEQMPALLKPFISARLIGILIENAVTVMKEYLSRNEQAALRVSDGDPV